jgi:hypothetical protein
MRKCCLVAAVVKSPDSRTEMATTAPTSSSPAAPSSIIKTWRL